MNKDCTQLSRARRGSGSDRVFAALAPLAVACIVGILNLTRIVEFFAFVGAVLDNAI